MISVSAAVVEELVEHDRQAQHNAVFVGVIWRFLVLDTDEVILTFGDGHWFHGRLRTIFANLGN